MIIDWWDRETWRFINSFAPWLSALGTLTAVVVSLYLATMQNRLRVRVVAARTRLVAMGQRVGEGERVVTVEVTNLSRRPLKLISVYWRALWKKGFSVQLTGAHPLSATLAAKLEADGGDASFIFPENVYSLPDNTDFVRRLFGGSLASFRSRFVRVGVATTVGKRFEGKLDPELMQWFTQLARKAEKVQSPNPARAPGKCEKT